MVLAILEHWFLVLPISATRIWNRMWLWSMGTRVPRNKLPQPLPGEATIGGHP